MREPTDHWEQQIYRAKLDGSWFDHPSRSSSKGGGLVGWLVGLVFQLIFYLILGIVIKLPKYIITGVLWKLPRYGLRLIFGK